MNNKSKDRNNKNLYTNNILCKFIHSLVNVYLKNEHRSKRITSNKTL